MNTAQFYSYRGPRAMKIYPSLSVSCGPFTHDKYSVFNLNALKSEVSVCVSVSSSFEISMSRSHP